MSIRQNKPYIHKYYLKTDIDSIDFDNKCTEEEYVNLLVDINLSKKYKECYLEYLGIRLSKNLIVSPNMSDIYLIDDAYIKKFKTYKFNHSVEEKIKANKGNYCMEVVEGFSIRAAIIIDYIEVYKERVKELLLYNADNGYPNIYVYEDYSDAYAYDEYDESYTHITTDKTSLDDEDIQEDEE